jgi:hypothetical protein
VDEPPSGEGEEIVPKLLYARTPEDAEEERKVHIPQIAISTPYCQLAPQAVSLAFPLAECYFPAVGTPTQNSMLTSGSLAYTYEHGATQHGFVATLL